MNQEKTRLLSTVRDLYGRVVWTHKTHEKDREICSSKAKRDKWINVILMALTTTGVLASIPLGSTWTTVLATLLAFASTLFALYRISFSYELDAEKHRIVAKALLAERESLLLLIERCMASNADLDNIRRELEKSKDRITQIYTHSPSTTWKAYNLASKGLKVNEELTFSAKEIDMLLPSELRSEKETV